jgi:hypothetical protein
MKCDKRNEFDKSRIEIYEIKIGGKKKKGKRRKEKWQIN